MLLSSSISSKQSYQPTSRYDHNTMSRVDVDSTADELEAQMDPQESYQSTSLRSVRQRKFLIATCLLVIILLIVGISVGVAGSGKASSADSIQPARVQNTPPILSERCSFDAISTVQGFKLCEELCEAAVCCRAPAHEQFGCFESNKDACGAYSFYCKNLDKINQKGNFVVAIPPAPVDLANICGETSRKTVDGASACEKACLPAECCYTTNSSKSCTHSNDECKSYKPCSVILGNSNEDGDNGIDQSVDTTTLKDSIDHACSDISIGVPGGKAACAALCSEGACCFADPANICETSPALKLTNCYDYIGCAPLFYEGRLDDSGEGISAVKSIVDTACSDESISVEGGEAACQSVCTYGSCCFKSEAENCFNSNLNVICHDYVSCSRFYKDAVDGAGTNDKAVNDDRTDDPNPSNGNNTTTKDAIDAACTEKAMMLPGGLASCQALCTLGDCCYADSTGSCERIGKESVNCHDYVGCSPMYDDFTQIRDNDAAALNIAVNAVCSNHSITNIPGGEDACLKICMAGSCCFKSKEESCQSVGSDVNCIDYEGCSRLHEAPFSTLGENKNNSVSLADSCYPKKDGSIDMTACKAACVLGACCFSSANGGCSSVGVNVDCEDYIPCSAVYVGGQDVLDAVYESSKSVIDVTCDQDALQALGGYEACQHICDAGSCCYAPAGNGDCASLNKNVNCSHYTGCARLYDANKSDTIELTTASLISTVCAEESANIPGSQDACSAMCNVAACCFVDADNNCEKIGRGFIDCQDYIKCESYFSSKVDAVTINNFLTAEEVISTCSAENLKTADGYDKCYNICIQHSCCFDLSPQKNCVKNQTDICVTYAGCEIVI